MKFVRRIFNLVLTIAILCFAVVAQAATVTDARWGIQSENVLRFVIAVDKPVTYNVKLEGASLRVLVNAGVAAQAKGTKSVRSSLADSMTMKQEGSLAVLEVPLKQSLAADNYKSFVLRQSAPGQIPYRIVVDLDGSKAAAKPTVSNQPVKKPANSGAIWDAPSSDSSSRGSWTDRFKKPGTVAPRLTPSERVRLSIEQARNAAKVKQQEQAPPVAATTEPAAPKISVEPAAPKTGAGQSTAPTQDEIKTAQAGAAVVVAKQVTQVPKETTTAVKANNKATVQNTTTQGDLKRILNAKREARRRAAAEMADKGKKKKDKDDDLKVIKGSGKYKISGGLKDKVITLDAGHGGSDPGAIGLGGTMEKNLTLAIAKKTAALLNKAGAKVRMTRTTDKDVEGPYASDKEELQARVNVAEKHNSDLFISIHINSSVNRDIRGVSSYYYPKSSHDARLAKAVQRRLVTSTGMNDLSVREAGFYVIKRSTMPAALLELGFISNRKEETIMRTNSYQEKAAQAIYNGIKQYFG